MLFDSWFSSPHQIVQLKQRKLDVIAMVKVSSKIKYEFEGERKNIKQIYRSCRKRRGRSRYLLSIPVKVGPKTKMMLKLMPGLFVSKTVLIARTGWQSSVLTCL